MQISDPLGSTTGSHSAASSAYAGIATAQINQFDAEKQVGGDGINTNCGPTSLVMALHRLGLKVAGETAGTNNGQAVGLARKSMAAGSATDGVDARGNWSESENNTYTDFDDLARGVAAAGAKSKLIDPTTMDISNALKSGASVVVSGTFAGKSPLPWMGDLGRDNKSAPGNAGAHIVLVSGYNESRNSFTINDPARRSVIEVGAVALTKFMEGNAGAIAIYR